jgi:hypothetical protein
MSEPVLLVSGVPGSGKSSFARWLAENKGYLHLDFDHGDFEKHRLHRLFDEFALSDSDQFVAELLKTDAPVCLDWGFPPRLLWIVRKLADAGVSIWWFDADPEVAKKHFLHRADVSEAAFDEQIANITASRGAIMEVFGDRVISAFRADRTHVPCEEIYVQLFK